MTTETASFTSLSWNVNGHTEYNDGPKNGSAIVDGIQHYREQLDVDVVSLSDAYRWGEHFGGEAGIAERLGYREARFMLIEDKRIDAKDGPGLGTVMATNLPIEKTTFLDLDTRQRLSTILGIGSYGVQLASVYLDDLNESVRIRQIKALLSGLEPDVPTLLMGDFNMLRPNVLSAGCRTKLGDLSVRMAAQVLPKRVWLGEERLVR